MAKRPEQYRLWEHDVEPPKKSEQTVIAKVDADAAGPTRTIGVVDVGRRARRACGRRDAGLGAGAPARQRRTSRASPTSSTKGPAAAVARCRCSPPRAQAAGRARPAPARRAWSSSRSSRGTSAAAARCARRAHEGRRVRVRAAGAHGCSPAGAQRQGPIRWPRGSGGTARFGWATRGRPPGSRTPPTSPSPSWTAASTRRIPT